MYELGRINTLKVIQDCDHGAFLGTEDNKVLLPNRYTPEDVELGEEFSVFIYTDSEDRPVATTETPKVLRDEIAALKVVDVSAYGYFLDWGLPKDLFLPFKESKKRYRTGDTCLVKVLLDDKSGRLIASAKFAISYKPEDRELTDTQKVDVIVADKHDTGYRVIINNTYNGMIYYTDIVKPLVVGDSFKAYIKKIREDGKIDIALRPVGFANNISNDKDGVLAILKESDGFLPYNSKSDPADIKRIFKLSKKSFKNAIGGLYKDKVISIDDDGIRLI